MKHTERRKRFFFFTFWGLTHHTSKMLQPTSWSRAKRERCKYLLDGFSSSTFLTQESFWALSNFINQSIGKNIILWHLRVPLTHTHTFYDADVLMCIISSNKFLHSHEMFTRKESQLRCRKRRNFFMSLLLTFPKIVYIYTLFVECEIFQ